LAGPCYTPSIPGPATPAPNVPRGSYGSPYLRCEGACNIHCPCGDNARNPNPCCNQRMLGPRCVPKRVLAQFQRTSGQILRDVSFSRGPCSHVEQCPSSSASLMSTILDVPIESRLSEPELLDMMNELECMMSGQTPVETTKKNPTENQGNNDGGIFGRLATFNNVMVFGENINVESIITTMFKK
jgi:hypothetical protein